MNRCAIQQKTFASCEEMRGGRSRSMSICVDKKETLVCPKPRRVGLIPATRPPTTTTTLNDPPVRPLRWHFSHQQEVCDSKAGNELLDIIFAKGGYGVEQSVAQMASSPPFFSGSPPSRVSNPLIQDARFGDEKFTPCHLEHSRFHPSWLCPHPPPAKVDLDLCEQILATIQPLGSRVSTASTGIDATAASLPWLREQS